MSEGRYSGLTIAQLTSGTRYLVETAERARLLKRAVNNAPNVGPSVVERREQMDPVEYQDWRDRGPKRHDCIEKPDCEEKK